MSQVFLEEAMSVEAEVGVVEAEEDAAITFITRTTGKLMRLRINIQAAAEATLEVAEVVEVPTEGLNQLPLFQLTLKQQNLTAMRLRKKNMLIQSQAISTEDKILFVFQTTSMSRIASHVSRSAVFHLQPM